MPVLTTLIVLVGLHGAGGQASSLQSRARLLPEGHLLLAQEIGREIPDPLAKPSAEAKPSTDPAVWDRYAGRTNNWEVLAGAGAVILVDLAELGVVLVLASTQQPTVLLFGLIGLGIANLGLMPLVATFAASLVDTGFWKAGTFSKAFLYAAVANLVGSVLGAVLLSVGRFEGFLVGYFASGYGASLGWHAGPPSRPAEAPGMAGQSEPARVALPVFRIEFG